ncbi:MAG: signal peptidase I [Verrucomicrobia bacterium]|nr:MAG: signal peptidase I [Verrucomicrobiota bacterium]
MKIVAWSVLIVVLMLFAVKALFVGYYRIPQNGMYPTLPAGSVLFTIRRPYSDISAVKRGDVIVFVREQNGQRYNYIWRVIGLPGDAVQTSGESLILNGQPAVRERLADANGKSVFRESIGNVSYEIAFDPSASERPPDVSVSVPPDHLFVMGDNRFNAFDSRRFGPIPFSSIIGKKL